DRVADASAVVLLETPDGAVATVRDPQVAEALLQPPGPLADRGRPARGHRLGIYSNQGAAHVVDHPNDVRAGCDVTRHPTGRDRPAFGRRVAWTDLRPRAVADPRHPD